MDTSQLLRIHYRYKQPFGFALLWSQGRKKQSTKDAWVTSERVQWLPASLEGARLTSAVNQILSASYPDAISIEIARIEILRYGCPPL